MSIDIGTNFFVVKSTGLEIALTNNAGDAILVRATTAGIPSAVAGYAIGCTLQNATTGSLFINQGTAASCSFRDVTY